MHTSATRNRHLQTIKRGNAPQYKEILRITKLAFPLDNAERHVVLASLMYYRFSYGSGSAYELSCAFHRYGLLWHTKGNRKLSVKSDAQKLAAVVNFINKTRPSTLENWHYSVQQNGLI